MDFRDYIRIISDFPKDGISYKDVSTLLKNGEIYRLAIDSLVKEIKPWQPDVIVGPEARGFLLVEY